jgi:hypothetical protein
MSRSRLELMFEHVCACRKLTEITSTPSWSGTRSCGTPSNPDVKSCAGSWAVGWGTGAHQQSRELPGSSCCLSLLAGGFWPTTYSGTHSAPWAQMVDQTSTILRDQFGILPKRQAIGYTKPYPSDYGLIPLPPKYRLPEFTKFSGAEGSSSIEHVS